MTKTFCTVFPSAANQHLAKDVGQIPHQMGLNYGYDAYLITETNANFENKEATTPGLKIHSLVPRGRFLGISIAAFTYVLRRAARIDVLNLYHLTPETKFLAVLYKCLNRKGFVYVKLDVNVQGEKNLLGSPSAPPSFSSKLRKIFNAGFIGAVDLFSGETKEAVELISKRPGFGSAKIIEVVNGIDLKNSLSLCPVVPPAKKENLFITVGRLGAPEKNTELLLQALERAELKDWRVALVGPFTSGFNQKYQDLCRKRPDLAPRVELIGNISTREDLLAWYSKAKVFILTSLSEGFPLVFSEAQCYGNFIISTDVSSMVEITDHGKYGETLRDPQPQILTSLLESITSGERKIEDHILSDLLGYAHKKYDWPTILQRVHLEIAKKLDV